MSSNIFPDPYWLNVYKREGDFWECNYLNYSDDKVMSKFSLNV